ncbi:inositol-trisphosphate 3-kinase B-like isoform X2 [Lithobates pipiens]
MCGWGNRHFTLLEVLNAEDSDGSCSASKESKLAAQAARKTKSWKTFFTMVHWSLRRQNSWVQLAGHEGNFKASERGHILKKFSPIENACLEALMEDILRPYVPTYHGLVEREGQTYIKMEDLLMGLEAPSIMDCKMGFRTYLEDELAKALLKPTPRKDLYNKMVALDSQAPTLEEHLQKAVTKPRYMQWRESVSSTAMLGFRIEGVTIEAGSVKKNFKKMKSREQIMETFVIFTKSRQDILEAYVKRLESMQAALKESEFFRTHEVIGSSLLFVHDRRGTSNVWMIDFGKTTLTPAHISLRHDVAWEPGTHEDGYLLGLQNLIDTLQDTIQMVKENREEAVDGSAQEGEQTIGENEKMLLKGEVEVKTTNGENNALMTPIQPGNRTL